MRSLKFMRALVVFLILTMGLDILAQPPPEQAVIRAIDAAELCRETRLRGYTVTEHYTIKSSRFNHSAEMTVAVVYRREQRETYKILSRRGSAMIQSSVFDPLLHEEEAMIHRAEPQHTPADSPTHGTE